MKPNPLLVAATAAMLALSACSSGTADKAGVTTPVVLSLGSTDTGTEDIPHVQAFVDAVSALTNGRITVRVSSIGTPPDGRTADLNAIDQVKSGKYAFGWVGTRSLAAGGMPAYAALGAPMLIDNYPLERAVVMDKGVLEALLPDTEAATGVTPLALLADRLRVPYSGAKPLTGPDDYKGKTVWITTGSVEQEAALAALGAKPAQASAGSSLNASLSSGDTDAVIFDPGYTRDNGMSPKSMTANVVFWPRTVLLIANPAALAALDPADRALVQQAAAKAVQASLTIGDDDAEITAQQCALGLKVVAASSTELTALRAAVQPAYDKLAADAATRGLLDRIAALKKAFPAMPPTVPAGCSGGTTTTNETPSAPPTPVFTPGPTPLDGTYRVDISEADVRAVGFTETTMPDGSGCPVENCITENVGLYTTTFANGTEKATQRSGAHINDASWEGRYVVDGDHVTVQEEDHKPYRYAWSIGTDGALTLTPDPKLPDGHPGLWNLWVRPLTRVK
ncbi:TRAP transporter substrate-binding protein [Propionicimonas sp.]|uniref:TRAP transporter substrate-binding protein n=1 Tax=Propionicimonas sp. TaxID=1955623 RepID=UPI0039E3E5DA